MLNSFLQSWPLFQWTYLAALFLAVGLATLGVLVVTRGQVFVAAAISQASLLGLAVNLWLGWGQPAIAATAFSGAAALVASRRRSAVHQVGSEEITGWLFLACASLAILILARQPVGLKEVQAMMASSVLGASATEAGLFAVLAGAALALPWFARRELVLLVTDPTMAAAVGLRVGRWLFLLALALGIGTGLAIRSSGLLFTFGCLVLPAFIARNLCREMAPMFWVAPMVAATTTLTGLVLAHGFDFPPGQLIVGLLALLLVLAWSWREAREWMWG